MGTRGLFGWVIDGTVKAAYCQFDSYPGGGGATVMNYIVNRMDAVEAWRQRVRDVEVVNTSNDDVNAAPAEVVAKARELGLVNMQVGGGPGIEDDEVTMYRALREAQGQLDLYEKVGFIPDDSDFALDSLFCEWGWLVNLDDGVLEVYRGFQTEPHDKGRFASMSGERYTSGNGTTYQPIALFDEVKFVDLLPGPDESVENVIGLEVARLEAKAYPEEDDE